MERRRTKNSFSFAERCSQEAGRLRAEAEKLGRTRARTASKKGATG
jgi:hypothetical protein